MVDPVLVVRFEGTYTCVSHKGKYYDVVSHFAPNGNDFDLVDTHDIPKPLVDFSIDMLSHAVIMGDKVGNLILQFYVFLIHYTF